MRRPRGLFSKLTAIQAGYVASGLDLLLEECLEKGISVVECRGIYQMKREAELAALPPIIPTEGDFEQRV